MNIIKHGNTYHEIKCTYCKAFFGYTNGETSVINVGNPFQNHIKYTLICIECPECQESIKLTKNAINKEDEFE